MKNIAVISVAVIGLTVSMLAQEPARRGFWPKLGGEFTPTASDELAKGPVPRMPDGRPDLHGPWVGGGSNGDIEADGGLKPGELPLLPWAKALRDSRKEDDEPYLYCTPMSVPRMNPYPWNFLQSVTSKGPGDHLYRPRERRRGPHPPYLHGRPEASRRPDPVVVGPLHRVVGKRHARDRHHRIQRQVLDGQPRHAPHRTDAHDRAVDAHQLRNADQ